MRLTLEHTKTKYSITIITDSLLVKSPALTVLLSNFYITLTKL